MLSYFYFIFLIGILSYFSYRSIIMYKKGTYNPYVFIGFKDDGELTYGKRVLINLIIIFGAQILVTDDKYTILFRILYVFLSINIIQTSILSYLSYKKIKDKKIITHNVIMNLIFIGIIIVLWKFT